jgi:hypothetical protein
MDGNKILEIAHGTAWKYKKSSDPHHSDTYTFNEHTIIDFVQKVTREAEERIKTLELGINAVGFLINESYGVAGLHKNGDLADWGFLLRSSWLEDWAEAEKLAKS